MRITLLLWLFFAAIPSAMAQQKPQSEKAREPEKTVTTPAQGHAEEIQMRREEKRKKMEAARQSVRDKIKSDTITRRQP